MKLVRYILLTLFIPCMVFAADDYDTHELRGIKLISVEYREAIVEIDFYLADKGVSNVYMGVQSSKVTGGYNPVRLNVGMNRYRFALQRSHNKYHSIETGNVLVHVYQPGVSTLWKNEVDLSINWPGPEDVQNILGGETIEPGDYLSIEKVYIHREIENGQEMYKSFLMNGVPITKIEKTSGIASAPSGLSFLIGEAVDPQSAVRLLSLTLAQTDSISEVGFLQGKESSVRNRNAIYIGGFSYPYLTKLSVDQKVLFKRGDLTNDEFYTQLGKKIPTAKERLDEKYHTAYQLIDSNSRSNVREAKVLLDEIILEEPEYALAYLEIARYHMKVAKNLDQEALAKAERSILVAKGLAPENPDVRVLLGYVYTKQERYEAAEKEYESAAKQGTDNLWLQANWGLNYQRQGERDKAVEQYLLVAEAPRKHDRNDRPKKWVHRRLSGMLIAEGEYIKADKIIANYARDFPEDRCAFAEQAEVRVLYLNDPDGSINSYMNSRDRGCRKYNAVLSLAYYSKWKKQLAAGDKDDARKSFLRAEAVSPDTYELMYELARSDVMSGMIDALKKQGRDIDAVSPKGRSALVRHIINGDIAATERLLKAGADPDITDGQSGLTPLMISVFSANYDMVKLLLSYTLDVDVRFPDGQTLQAWAKSMGLEDVAKLLQDG